MAVNSVGSLQFEPDANPVTSFLQGYNKATESKFLNPTLQQKLKQLKAGTQVAQGSVQAKIALANALAQHEANKAALVQAHTQAYPKIAAANVASTIATGPQKVALEHPIQRAWDDIKGWFGLPPSQNNLPYSGSVNSNVSQAGAVSPPTAGQSNDQGYGQDQNLKAFFSNPKISDKQKSARVQQETQQAYDHYNGKGAWEKLPSSKKNQYMMRYAQANGLY